MLFVPKRRDFTLLAYSLVLAIGLAVDLPTAFGQNFSGEPVIARCDLDPDRRQYPENVSREGWVCGSSPHWRKRDGKFPKYTDQLFVRMADNGRVKQMWTLAFGDIREDQDNPDVSCLNPGETVGIHCIAENSKGNGDVGDIYGERAQKFTPVTTRPKAPGK